VLIDFAADSGAAEMYTADERKMSIFPNKKAVSMLWYSETNPVIQAPRRYRLESSSSSFCGATARYRA
jgi:hypothetical protein